MYKLTNRSLEPILEKFGVESLDEVSMDDLYLVCEELGVKGIFLKDKKGRATELDRFETISEIEDTLTLTVYMGQPYWNEAQRNKVEANDVLTRLSKVTRGERTFDIMEKMKLGVNNLRPGASVEVDWNPRYIREVWATTPWGSGKTPRIVIEDLSNNRTSDRVTKDTIEEPIEQSDWAKLSYNALKQACKDRGLKYINVPAKTLIESLSEFEKNKGK